MMVIYDGGCFNGNLTRDANGINVVIFLAVSLIILFLLLIVGSIVTVGQVTCCVLSDGNLV